MGILCNCFVGALTYTGTTGTHYQVRDTISPLVQSPPLGLNDAVGSHCESPVKEILTSYYGGPIVNRTKYRL